MNNRRLTWLPITIVLLACSQPLVAQSPGIANNPVPAKVGITVGKPAATFFYSDAAIPAAATPTRPGEPTALDSPPIPATPKSPQAPAPPVLTVPPRDQVFFYSDLNEPSNIDTASSNVRVPSNLPVAPLPAGLAPLSTPVQLPVAPLPGGGYFLVEQQKSTSAKLAPQPTKLAPLRTPARPAGSYLNVNTNGARRWTGNRVHHYLDQPANFSSMARLVNQDTATSPSDETLTPAQKGCSKWCRTLNIWGEFLYLRSRDSEVTYAVETNTSVAPPTPPVQVGRVGMIDQTADPGFRFGVTYLLDESSSLTFSWAMLESHRTDRIDRTSLSNVIESMVLHPTTAAASSSGTFATGIHDIDFDLVDLEYRGRISTEPVPLPSAETNYVIGLRYVNLQQQFLHNNDIIGNQTVATDIDFNGVGVRLGLEGERFRHKSGCFFYGKTYVNFIAGEFNAKFDQGQAFDASVVDTLWEAGRIVSIWELELGLGHVCKSERFSVSLGYSFSAWTNVVKTDEFIHAVQTNNFLDLGETMTYDGLVGRVEGRF